MPRSGNTAARGYGGKHQALRRTWAPTVEAGLVDCHATVCLMPSRAILPGQAWHLGHTEDRTRWTGPEHELCNQSDGGRRGAAVTNAKWFGSEPRPLFLVGSDDDPRASQRLSLQNDQDYEIRSELLWNPEILARYGWLKPFIEIPDDAAPPLAMSPPPPDAVGSYGAEAISWIERTQRIELRWWQRLAVTRQLEHREDGSLCHRSVVESTPRRAGKSVRIRGMALWRLGNAELLGETQTVIHTGSDVAICREIQRGVWRWCEESAGWRVSRANGKEAVETPGGDRWLVRAQSAVYGYDACFGVVDEGWNVAPDTVSEGLEPAALERKSPQLHLTSTAHRRATSLMRSALLHAFSTDDPETLLLLWGARPGCDPADPEVWKSASPYWSEDRRKMIAAKYEKALAGEDDPELDDPDPMRGFEAQYLNVWRLKERRSDGDPVISEDDWAGLVVEMPDRVPDAVSVEDWFGEGVSVARAWHEDGLALISLSTHADLAEAAAAVRETRFTSQVLVGASIASDPAWERAQVHTEPQQSTIRAAVEDLDRMLADGVLAHDGGAALTEQVLSLRTLPGVDGPRVRSKTPADAVKAAMRAAVAVRNLQLPAIY